ncbi:hypothetical protein P170DRAFT_425839 [Aspergillus steynii IBT 23096]|uniref:Uncharacterized protein n=1 Tax=Aspergillus steynii IBT 23096 TaxID=1392250 RepID=A0A2I2G7I7_9EURO|nr:uncharacterized protein P170DRAFT_425839 [Aspergillus steynii IBT 23096]PLB48831.1 hypothetical protein P170DRAFT_425839 [Aspergillus steynii IBT 23096]
MSAAITSQIANTDDFYPNGIQPGEKEKITPWVFREAEFADLGCVERWPDESTEFKEFFHLFNSYVSEANLFDTTEPDLLQAYYPESQCRDLNKTEPGLLEDLIGRIETITLPRKSWKYSTRDTFAGLMVLQGLALRTLIDTIYRQLKMTALEPRLHFPVSNQKQTYFIGGQKYTARPDYSVTIRLENQHFPILSFTGWFPGQTWNGFLGETLAIMLGQLASNIQFGLRDQEIFVLGFYKRQRAKRMGTKKRERRKGDA